MKAASNLSEAAFKYYNKFLLGIYFSTSNSYSISRKIHADCSCSAGNSWRSFTAGTTIT